MKKKSKSENRKFSYKKEMKYKKHNSNHYYHRIHYKRARVVPWLKKIIWVIRVLRRTVVSDWRFDNLCGSHLQSQVVVIVSWKLKNPGERFDWSVGRVAAGKCVILRTPITQMIFFNQGMLLLGSNLFLREWSFDWLWYLYIFNGSLYFDWNSWIKQNDGYRLELLKEKTNKQKKLS